MNEPEQTAASDKSEWVVRGGYCFVSTIVDVEVDLPVVLTDHVRLERAKSSQIEALKQIYPHDNPQSDRIEYGRECKYIGEPNDAGGTTIRPVPLAHEQWRYFLLAYEGSGKEAFEVANLCLLADPPFACGMQVSTSGEFGKGDLMGWGGGIAVQPRILHPALNTEPVPRITDCTIADIREAWGQFTRVVVEYPEIARAVRMVRDLGMVPRHSSLYVLGLFAIIEMLLTHNPFDRENADSLNHQLSTKIPLVDRRLPERIDYSPFDRIGSATRVWKSLYAYRSQIAHGGAPDFSRELRPLRDPQSAVAFVEEACRKLVRHAIREPELYLDLRAV